MLLDFSTFAPDKIIIAEKSLDDDNNRSKTALLVCFFMLVCWGCGLQRNTAISQLHCPLDHEV